MDLVKVEGFRPVDLIEEYSSLIWTNRFFEAGDFQLKTPKIEETMDILPPGTVLGLLDDADDTAMIVDEHHITVDAYGRPELTVIGREATTIHEGRPALKFIDEPIKDHEYIFKNVTPSFLINKIIQDSYHPVTSRVNATELLNWDLYTLFTSPDNDPKVIKDFQVPRQDVYTTVTDIAKTYGLGYSMGWRYSDRVKQQYPYNALINRTTYGRDMRSPLSPMFSGKGGDFLSEDLLISHKEYFNSVFLYTENTMNGMWFGTDNRYIRRIKAIDASDIKPPEDTGIRDSIEYENALGRERARQALYKYARRKFLSVEVSPSARAKYGTDYKLGDIVSVEGSYSGVVDMRVEEYIRSEDDQGEKAYPGFAEYVLPNMEGVE